MRTRSCCWRSRIKRDWTKEEDEKIVAYVSNHGTPKWTALPKLAGVKRCGKCCKIRWTNYLKPGMDNDSFTPEEDDLIVKLHAAVGNRWTLIAKILEDVKKHWKIKLAKKLIHMGIDPVTHKSYSEIFSGYATTYTTVAPTQQAAVAPKPNKKAKVVRKTKLPTIQEKEENEKVSIVSNKYV